MLGNSTGQNIKFIALASKASATDTPAWWTVEKNAEGKYKKTTSFNFIEGLLNRATISVKEFKPGEKENWFQIEMEDNGEIYKVDMPHSQLAYSIINAIASNANSMQRYKITLKKEQNGQYWNSHAYVNVDGARDMQKWKVNPQETPKAETVMHNGQPVMANGKKVMDRTKQKEFWETFFKENIVAHLTGGSQPTTSGAPVSGTPVNNAVTATSEQPDDFGDLPF